MREAASGEVSSEGAEAFVKEAYRWRSEASEDAVRHPLAVAELLREDGQPPMLVLAGLLHDLLEDTDVTREELRQRFGSEAGRLVEALTQDPSIEDYHERKAALRRQILEAGPEVATVALADKTAKLSAENAKPKQRRLEHYRATLEGIEERYGGSRLSARLRGELERFQAS